MEAVPVAGTEATSGRTARAAGNALEAFGRAQDAIIEVAKSTAEMIEKAGAAGRPDRVEVEFGLKFSVSGGVIMAGVAGEASLKVTLGYDLTARPAVVPPVGAVTERAADKPSGEPTAGSWLRPLSASRIGGCRGIWAGCWIVTAHRWGLASKWPRVCW